MRVSPLPHIAVLMLALAAFAPSASASERYECTDGTFVEVNRDNRALMKEHPCVKAWFERREEIKKAHLARQAARSEEQQASTSSSENRGGSGGRRR